MRMNQVEELQMMIEVAALQLKDLEQANRSLKSENKRLSELLDNTVSKAQDEREEQFICANEIKKLKIKSRGEDGLTLEDTKKLEAYHKILNNLTPKEQSKVEDTDKMSTEELLKKFDTLNKAIK